jgi:hypothetical protein
VNHAGIGFPNGPVDNATVFSLPSPDLLMLSPEGRWHHDEAVRAGKRVLSDMLPDAAVDDVADQRARDTESFSQDILSYAGIGQMPNLNHLSACQFGRPDLLTASLTLFLDHVRTVVGGVTQKQVVRTDAGRVVACVANEQIARDGAESDQPRQSVGEILFAATSDLAIAVREQRPDPQPARSFVINLGDELPHGLGALTFCAIGTGKGAVTASCDVGRLSKKGRAATFAGTLYGHQVSPNPGVTPPVGRTTRGLCMSGIIP